MPPKKKSVKSEADSSATANEGSSHLNEFLDVKLSASTARDELTRVLKKLSSALVSIESTASKSKQLKEVAGKLVNEHITKHKSKEVQLLGACCLADIMRIFAPTPPYSAGQLKVIFEIFFAQLKGLTEPSSEQFAWHFHLLESLAQVNTFLVLTTFDDETMLIKCVRLLFSLCKADLNTKVEKYFLDILGQFVKEVDSISAAFLDVILLNLVPPFSDSNPGACNLAVLLLRNYETNLESPVVTFVTNVLQKRQIDGDISERDKQLKLIFHLLVHVPQLLQSCVIPLQNMMEVSDPDDPKEYTERLENVTLFGDVFCAPGPRTMTLYTQLFDQLVKRLADISPEIRLYMATFAEHVLTQHQNLREPLLNRMSVALEDRDERVRKACIDSLCSAGLKDPELLSPELLVTLQKRAADKKEPVRHAAFAGLSKLFLTFCAESWKLCRPLPVASKRYSSIPKKLLSLFDQLVGRGDREISKTLPPFVDTLVHETFLGGNAFSLVERARCLVGIYASLDEDALKGFARLFVQKHNWQELVRKLLKVQAQIKEHDRKEKAEYERLCNIRVLLANELIHRLALCPDEKAYEKTVKDLVKILDHKNNDLRKWLKLLCNDLSCLTYEKIGVTQTELARAIKVSLGSGNEKKGSRKKDEEEDKEKELGPAGLGYRLCQRLALLYVTQETFPLVFDDIASNLNTNREKLCGPSMELLVTVSRHFPAFMLGSYSRLLPLLKSTNASLQLSSLKLLALCQPRLTQDLDEADGDETLDDKVCGDLQDVIAPLVPLGPPTRSKLAVRALAALLGNARDAPESSLAVLGTELTSPEVLDVSNPHLAGALRALAEFFKSKVHLNAAASEAVLAFVLDKLLKANPVSNLNVGSGSSNRDLAKTANPSKKKGAGKKRKAKEVEDGEDEKEEELESTLKRDCLPPLELLEAQKAGIKLLAQHLLSTGAQTPHFTVAMRTLASIVKTSGALPRDPHSKIRAGALSRTAEEMACDCTELLLCSTKAMLKLLTHPVLRAGFEKEKSFTLASVFMQLHADHLAVRERLYSYLHKLLHVSKPPLPFRYAVLLAYAAHEKDNFIQMQSSFLSRLLEKQRQANERNRHLAGQVSGSVPELALADLVYFLSKHEDFQDSDPNEDHSDVYTYFRKILEMFMQLLLPKTSSRNNYSLVLEITHAIKNCEDVRDPNNTKIYKLAEISQLILKEQWENKEWGGSEHPGQLRLPEDMYRPRETRPLERYLPESVGSLGSSSRRRPRSKSPVVSKSSPGPTPSKKAKRET